MALLFHVEYAAFGYSTGDFESGVKAASALRRVTSLLVAGAFGGVAWFVLRRYTPGRKAEIDDVLWTQSGELSVGRSLGTSVISEIVIGMGASLGREAAPKLMGGVSGGLLGRWFGLSGAQQRLLIACGGGAGLGCVSNVPLGGAFFTAEILCGSVSVATMLPALACSSIATITAWVYLPNRATYLDVPSYHLSATLLTWSLVAGPLIGLGAAAYIRGIGWLSHHRLTGIASLFTPLIAFGVLRVIGIAYPQLFGNGQDMAHDAFLGRGALALLLALAVLKPAVTALCVASGASGGLFTPVMSTGAVLGGGLGLLWSHVWPGAPRRCVRDGRRGRDDRLRDTGTYHRVGAGSGTHPQRIRPDARDDPRDRRLHRCCALHRRVFHLFRPADSAGESAGIADNDVIPPRAESPIDVVGQMTVPFARLRLAALS